MEPPTARPLLAKVGIVLSILVGSSALTFRASGNPAPVTDYAVQSNPSMVAVGDVNGDTLHDLVVSNAGGGVSVLLGDASGGFGAATHFPTATGPGRIPNSVSINNLNADTFPDLIVGTGGNGTSTTVQVLLGDGTGSFGPAAVVETMAKDPWSVATGDFNGDGKIDIASANRDTDNVSVLPGNGDGTFGSPATYPVGSLPTAIAAGDLNGDSRPDLVTSNGESGDVSVLLANGSGTFQSAVRYAAGSYPFGVAIGDLNGDGIPDLAVADSLDDGVHVLLNDGRGGFGAAAFFPTGDGAGAVALGDLDNDSIADLAVANYFADTITVLAGDGTGEFVFVADHPASAPYWVAIERFGNDPRPDLAFVNSELDTVTVRLNSAPRGAPRADISRVTVSGPTTGREGRSVRFSVRITNSGDASATGVRLRAGGWGGSSNATVGTIAPGATKTISVRGVSKVTGRLRTIFQVTSANAGGKIVRR